MSEGTSGQPNESGATSDYEPTGNAEVDGVVTAIEGLEGAPIAAHVPAFESAHEQLRVALARADTGNAPPTS